MGYVCSGIGGCLDNQVPEFAPKDQPEQLAQRVEALQLSEHEEQELTAE
jgi:hypothetical protein